MGKFLFFIFISLSIWADPYQDLGVSSSSSLEEIKSAYKKKIKEVHPDLKHKWEGRLTHEQAEALAKKYNEAFDFIKKNHGKPTATNFRQKPRSNPNPNQGRKWEPPNWGKREEKPQPPKFTAEDWEKKIRKEFSGKPEELPEYLRKVTRGNPLLQNKEYKDGLKKFLAMDVTSIVKKSPDAKLILEIGKVLNNAEKIQDIWVRAATSKADFVDRLKKLKPHVISEQWEKLRINHHSLFFADLQEFNEAFSPPPKKPSYTAAPRQASPPPPPPKGKCLKESLAARAYREMGNLNQPSRGSTIDMSL